MRISSMLNLASALVWISIATFGFQLGAIGQREANEPTPILKLHDCEEVWAMAPSGVLRFGGGVLRIRDDIQCETSTVRHKTKSVGRGQ